MGTDDEMATWRELIADEMKSHGETLSDLISCTLSDEGLDRGFHAGYGGEQGSPFTAWSETWVYFPICYDGSEWCGSAPRNPCDKAMCHQGG